MLKARIISAVVLGLAALLLTWLGDGYFRFLIALGGAAVFYEWSMIVRDRQPRAFLFLSTALMAIVLLLLLAGAPAATLWLGLGAGVAVAAVAALVLGHGGWSAAGIAYAGIPAISLVLLRDVGAAGLIAILYLFAVVWATDIAAYFAGRRFGGPRLAPAISPGKTWSGAVGGTVGGVLAGLAVLLWSGVERVALMTVLSILLSITSQIGDLFESFLKRRFGVKDSGRLVPGHGGFMDRVDGLVAAAFVLYLCGAIVGGMDSPSDVLFAR